MNISNDAMVITLATEVEPFDVKGRIGPRFHDELVMKGTIEKSTFTKDTRSPEFYNRISLKDALLLETDFVPKPTLLKYVLSCGDKNRYFTQSEKNPCRFSSSFSQWGLIAHNAARTVWEFLINYHG